MIVACIVGKMVADKMLKYLQAAGDYHLRLVALICRDVAFILLILCWSRLDL
jgi:hypothetical protein